MIVKNNYNKCLTNLACSIRKYFELDYQHQTLDYIDNILNEYQPKNVVTILCDGMGYNIMNRVLEKNDFLVKNTLKPITTVFPATTVAATTSMITGLNPVETGMLGWNSYYKELDKVIATFLNHEKNDPYSKILSEAIEYNQKYMKRKSIVEYINGVGKYKGYSLFPFGDDSYNDIDDMYNRISKLCQEDGKKYIYAYNENPDHTMHELGSDSQEVKKIIQNINQKIQVLSDNLKDTIIFVVADHGHINVENIYLNNYPDILDCMIRTTTMEPRAVNFFIKNDKKDLFIKLFHKHFNDDFDLYHKEEVINSKLFGDGKENIIFRDELGDFLAIAKTNKTLLTDGDYPFKSQHAGYTDDEIYIPLIVIETKKSITNSL